MLLVAAINGSRRTTDHVAIPAAPPELALAAGECVAASADAVYFQVRDEDGQESLAAAHLAAGLLAIRSACPGVPLGLGIGARIDPDVLRRYRQVARWETLPDFALVHFDEPGATAIATLLLDRGVHVEAGLASETAAAAFVASGLARHCARILLEPREQKIKLARETVAALEALLKRERLGLPRLLHGLDATAWPLIELAVARGYDTRVGFEDVMQLPNGRAATSNAELVQAVRSLAKPAS